MKGFAKVISWVFGGLFLVAGLGAFIESTEMGFAYIFLGYLLLPPIRVLAHRTTGIAIPGYIRAFCIIGAFFALGIFSTDQAIAVAELAAEKGIPEQKVVIQPQIPFHWAVLLAIGIVVPFILGTPLNGRGRGKKRKQAVKEFVETENELREIVAYHFQTQPCKRCHEYEMTLLSVSPNGRSIEYQCYSCSKKMRAPAASPRAFSATEISSRLQGAWEYLQEIAGENFSMQINFSTPKAPLPFEQTKREHINQAVRTEVWRRDGGKCVECDSQQQLEYDHIIPVVRGGATTVRNLQLLCKSCNLRKGSKI